MCVVYEHEKCFYILTDQRPNRSADPEPEALAYVASPYYGKRSVFVAQKSKNYFSLLIQVRITIL